MANRFPFYDIQEVALTGGADMSVTVGASMYIKITGLTAARTLTLTPDADANGNVTLVGGERILIDVVQDGTGRNVTFGGNVVAPNITGVANDRDTVELMYVKLTNQFIGVSTKKVIDAA